MFVLILAVNILLCPTSTSFFHETTQISTIDIILYRAILTKSFSSSYVLDPDPKSLRVMHHFTEDDNAGWMPKRGDFVYEWSNEAEEILADLEISPHENNNVSGIVKSIDIC